MVRSRGIYYVLIIVAVFFIVDPFSLGKKSETIPKRYQTKDTVNEYTEIVKTVMKAPEEYLVDEFGRRDIILLGYMERVKDHLVFMNELLPLLPAAGIETIAVDFLLAKDQPEIDAFLESAAYDEETAKHLIFDFLPTWAYLEYINFLKTAWQTKNQGAAGLRIVGLSIVRDYSYIQTEDDIGVPELMRKVVNGMVPDLEMAKTVVREIITPGRKGLVFVPMSHTLAGFIEPKYAENMTLYGYTETRRMGKILKDDYGGRIATVLLHMPWSSDDPKYMTTFPADALIDAVAPKAAEISTGFGIDVSGSPLGAFEIKTSVYADAVDPLTFDRMCDGYIYLRPIWQYEAVTLVPDFITEDNYDAVLANFPGPKIENVPLDQFMNWMLSDLNSLTELLRRFK